MEKVNLSSTYMMSQPEVGAGLEWKPLAIQSILARQSRKEHLDLKSCALCTHVSTQ